MNVEILQNKNAATRFQILVELAAGGPNIRQKAIAVKLGVTPQAISDYMRQLDEEHLVSVSGQSGYRITPQGVNWMLTELRNLRTYIGSVEKAVTNISASAAIAGDDLEKGQVVGLEMRGGLLYATASLGSGAIGTAVSTVKKGQDVDVAGIQGLVELSRGRITILQVPGIQKGGSRQVKAQRLKEYLGTGVQVGTIGIEALVAVRQAGVEPRYLYGVTEAAIEGAQCGLSFTIACTEDYVPELMKRLRDEGIEYDIIDVMQG